MNYATARRDFEALEKIAILDDQVELDAERESLMRNPTKSYAGGMYQMAIRLWFQEHGVRDGSKSIADRYNIVS